MQRLPSRYRQVILSMLGLAMLINYMDRAALSVALPFMSRDFHLNASEKGLILSSFFIGYALFNFLGGYLSDRIGPKRVFVWSMSAWSVFCGLTALASGFWSLLGLRLLFGAGEGPISTTANKVVNNWFPLKERARSIGINQAGGPLGGALAGPVIGFLSIQFGWRIAFVVVAFFGICWMLLWRRVASDTPATHPRVNAEELNDIVGPQHDATTAAPAMSLKTVLKNPAVYMMALSLFCCSYNQFFFLTWFPTYLVEVRGMSLAQMSFYAAIPWLAGAIGYVCSGVVIDFIFLRTGRRLFSRKVVLSVCLLGAAVCMFLTNNSQSAAGAVTFMSLGVSLLMVASPAYWALIQDVVPDNAVGSASGIMHGLGNTSGIIGPVVTGMLVQTTHVFSSAFMLAAGLALLGAIVVIFGIRGNDVPRTREKRAYA